MVDHFREDRGDIQPWNRFRVELVRIPDQADLTCGRFVS